MAKKRIKKAGLPPGSIVFTGKRKVDKIDLHYVQYNEKDFEEYHLTNQSIQSFHSPVPEYVQWYDVRGVHDTDLIEEIGKTFKVHPLVLEDIADTHQRPKYDEYIQGNFIVIRALSFDQEHQKVKTEQVAIYIGDSFLLSFQENADDLFVAVRERIKGGRPRIRSRGADYLAYALVDSVVDNYFQVLDGVEETIEVLEAEILTDPSERIKSRIHHLKQEMLVMRKSIAPLREAINRFAKSETAFTEERNQVFLRDLYDHTIQVADMVETYRDLLSGLQDLYLSEISFRMNKVMQLLTIITTVFVPLSFFTGLYGMNFEYIPELSWRYGYFALWGLILLIVSTSLWLFKRKGWL